MSSAADSTLQKPPFSWGRVLMVTIPALVVAGAVYAVAWREANRESREMEVKLQAEMGFGPSPSPPMRLAEKYADADGDLVADAPQDASKQISPDTLVFAYIAGPAAENERDNWKEFVAFVSKSTGKPAEMTTFKTIEEQMAAFEDGKLHLTGFNTGNVPLAVNTAGFVPVCTPGRADGGMASSTMQLIVPNDSSIRTPMDLKSHTIAFTERSSNSGYKAALVHLRDQGLLPQRDYNCRFSGGHNESIRGIASGEYQAATVASDLLRKALAEGIVDVAQIRVIDESKPFPPATLGYAYNLTPALGEKIKAAMLEFDWAGTGLEKQFAGTGATKFVPLSYKSDFEWTRLIAEAVQDPPDVAIEKDQPSQ